jgi:protein involved in polysaccharide export with SLBB domain
MQRIRPNDVIIVGQQKSFYVYGEVRKPGMYPVEDDLNVMRVLAIGGGVSERGSSSRIRILRKMTKARYRKFPQVSVMLFCPEMLCSSMSVFSEDWHAKISS